MVVWFRMNGLVIVVVSCICGFSSLMFSGCSDKDVEDNNRQYIMQLNEERSVIEYLMEDAIYGTVPGTFPKASKVILETMIAEIFEFIDKLNAGEHTDQQVVNAFIEKAEGAVKKFKDSVIVDVSQEERNLQQLKNKMSELQNLLVNSVYGDVPGTYPEESKTILEIAIQELEILINGVTSGEIVSLTNEMVIEAIQKADGSVDDFRDTEIKKETIYNLYVDGNQGGYIDFGYKQEFADFGANQHAAFTIELWVKIDEYCNKPGEDNSTYLAASNDSPWGGWRIYSRYHNGNQDDVIRTTIAYKKDADKQNVDLWEPLYRSPLLGYQKWMHFAVVYAEDGVPGEDQDERFRMFYNGDKKGESIRLGQDVRQWSYSSTSYTNARIPMTAFCRLREDGSRVEYFSGFIKYMRIWKKARTADEIKKAAQGDYSIDSSDPNLVCAWDFVVSEKNLNKEQLEFTDLTGRHTATLKGSYSWKPIGE